jgi:predicted CoA-binding protein
MNSKKTLVLGASTNPDRYSYLAANKLLAHHHPVVLVGNKEGIVSGNKIQTGTPAEEGIHTVTLYLNPTNQKPYYDYILSLQPKRIIFNPDTENPELSALAVANGIQAVEACTLVMLSVGNF